MCDWLNGFNGRNCSGKLKINVVQVKYCEVKHQQGTMDESSQTLVEKSFTFEDCGGSQSLTVSIPEVQQSF